MASTDIGLAAQGIDHKGLLRARNPAARIPVDSAQSMLFDQPRPKINYEKLEKMLDAVNTNNVSKVDTEHLAIPKVNKQAAMERIRDWIDIPYARTHRNDDDDTTTTAAGYEEILCKTLSEKVAILSIRECNLPATPRTPTKKSKTFVLDVTPAEKAYISGSSNVCFGDLRMTKDLGITLGKNKDTDSIETKTKTDAFFDGAKRESHRYRRSNSVSPELLREKAGARAQECYRLAETERLLVKDPAIASIGPTIKSPHRGRPAESDRFKDLLGRLRLQIGETTQVKSREKAETIIIAKPIHDVLTKAASEAPEQPEAPMKIATMSVRSQIYADSLISSQEQVAENMKLRRTDSGYLSPTQESGDSQETPMSNASKTANDRLREAVFGLVKHEKNDSHDSGLSLFNDQSVMTESVLNPKAREFSPVKEKKSMRSQCLVLNAAAGTEGYQKETMEEAAARIAAMIAAGSPVKHRGVHTPNNFFPANNMNTQMPPVEINNFGPDFFPPAQAAMTAPPGFNLHPMAPPPGFDFPPMSAPPGFNGPPMVDFNSMMDAAQMVMPFPEQNFMAMTSQIPPFAPQMPMAVQQMQQQMQPHFPGAVFPQPAIATAQVPFVASMPAAPARRAPRPCRKPKAPNSMGQQAYEAWVEHLRMTEPGYHLKCKERQQRRSQRKQGGAPA
ncbi:hypothetical protein NKR23_g1373 [Pleurostoma richardsiae]|uniref:Uncharacterized protein n=1 Tax=Pleurostoma richardsiae TaxID=41990 RepID=A0AA38VJV2_9PEZI|nr:hypothetical protein NKR23_g1373 [Pleurostoma richardsiae]